MRSLRYNGRHFSFSVCTYLVSAMVLITTSAQLKGIRLEDDDEGYTDITAILVSKCQKLKNETVVKSHLFNLFEGTHALEVMNAKLDSGLIELSEEELNFDVSEKRSLKEVCWISDSIFRSMFTWLNHTSLTQTLFSNRYVEELLVNYSKSPMDGLNASVLTPNFVSEAVEDDLTHLVVRNVALGCLFFVRIICSFVQGGAVYEEEDINSQTMNLDLLSYVHLDDVLNLLEQTVEFLKQSFPDSKDSEIIQAIVHILKDLLKFPLFLNTKIPPKSFNVKYDTSFINSSLERVKFLQDNIDYLNSLPEIKGCYSNGIQKRLDNPAPPRDLISYKTEDYSSVRDVFTDFNQIFTITDYETATDVVSHGQAFGSSDHHVIARAFYPMLVLRDDRSILGHQSLNEFLIDTFKEFSGYNTELLNSDNQIANNKVNEFFQQISLQYFELLSVPNQNPCRQRQHLSRLIVQFDSLQAGAENLEVSLSDVFQLKDDFKENIGDEQLTLALPLTSWLYFTKLEIMIFVILRGFELDLYKIWEYHSMYFYASYLINHSISLLKRVIRYNDFKIETIKAMKAKLKKKKGEQKQRYKEKYEFKLSNDVPSLTQINRKLNEKLTHYEILVSLVELQISKILELTKHGVISTPEFAYAHDAELLYNLRMKSFSTVGIPEFPTYQIYQREIKRALVCPVSQIGLRNNIIKLSKEIVDAINSSQSFEFGIDKETWLNWFRSYQKSCIGICLFDYKGESASDVRVDVITDGYHRYFPVLKLVKK